MADVFISYAHADDAAAAAVEARLIDEGLTVWRDPQMSHGAIRTAIQAELDRARCVVAIWSRASVGSHWVIAEAQHGLDRGCLVGARLDDVAVPIPFNVVYTLDLRDWSPPAAHTNLARLVKGVRGVLDEAPVERPLASAQPPRRRGSLPIGSWAMLAAGVAAIAIAALIAVVARQPGPQPVAAIALRIESPPAGARVAHEERVVGAVTGQPHEVWLIIRSEENGVCYIQRQAVVTDGRFIVAALFAERHQSGVHFSMRAVADPVLNLIEGRTTPCWPEAAAQSPIVGELVRR